MRKSDRANKEKRAEFVALAKDVDALLVLASQLMFEAENKCREYNFDVSDLEDKLYDFEWDINDGPQVYVTHDIKNAVSQLGWSGSSFSC